MSSQANRLRVLVLPGDILHRGGGLEFLRLHFDVHEACDFKSAMDAMREGHFDAVFSELSNFLPLERAAANQQSAAVLDALGEGVCIVDDRGKMIWANRRLGQFQPEALRTLREVCAQAYERMAAATFPELGKSHRYRIASGDGAYYEVICSPIYDSCQCLRQVAAVVTDATALHRQHSTLQAIERAGYELVRLDTSRLSGHDMEARRKLLEDRIIRSARDVLNFEHIAVLLLDDETGRLTWLTRYGLDDDVDRNELFAGTEGNGICGYVAATGNSYLCNDTAGDPRYLRGLTGAKSSLTVPLRLHDRVIGVLNVESYHSGAFGETERQFAEVFAHYVAMALSMLDLRNDERRNASNELRDTLRAEVRDPLNEIIVRTMKLREDYIANDDLRRRAGELLDIARSAWKAMPLSPPPPAFRVLPKAQEENDSPTPETVKKDRRILVVDDESLICKMLRDAMASPRCIIETCESGSTALARIREEPFDCIITDLRLPGASGYEVLASATCPVLLMTAFAYEPDHPAVLRSGKSPAGVFYKPFNVDELLDRVEQILGDSQGRPAPEE